MYNFSKSDEMFMARALELAAMGRNRTKSNPMVGAVIVKDGKVIGEGYHRYFGGPHAEIEAIGAACEVVKGSTMYVSLEPCCHQGKTPACTSKIIEMGVSRVVIASVDPNPLVAGKGIELLKRASINVDIGLMDKEQKALNEKFIHFITKKRPFVMMKSAISLDGKIATRTGDSKWISSEEVRAFTRKMRGEYQAIMVGINTVIADDPRLTAAEGDENPLKIVVDSKLKIPLDSYVVKNAKKEPLFIITTEHCDKEKKRNLENLGVEVMEIAPQGAKREEVPPLGLSSAAGLTQTKEENRRIDLGTAMAELGKKGISSIFLEGGGGLNYSMVSEGLVNKFLFVVSPKIIGGKKALTAVEGEGFEKVSDAVKLRDMKAKSFGDEIIITAYLKEE